MEKSQAVTHIENLFDHSFDEALFVQFCSNLFNDFNTAKATSVQSGNYVYEPYRNHIKSFKRLGQYVDSDGEIIDILSVKVKDGYKLERTRIGLRNFAIEYLKRKVDRDTLLIAFHSEDSNDWRLSYVKIEYKTFKDKKGKIKARQEATSAKRFSFLVGETEPCHTAKKQFLPLLVETDIYPTIQDVEQCFNIEKVTKEFFGQYKALYLNLLEKLEKIIKKDKAIRDEFSKKDIDSSAFAKKLLGQIVFLYFIQKKGWLGVPKDKSFGQGDKRFLKSLFKKADTNKENYFKDYLEHLFYEALAVQRNSVDPSYYKKFNCRIPFLNGGLFEPMKDYNWKNTEIVIPNEIFSNTEVTKEGDVGTGILDVFDRYNFTVKEDEPLEKEVAVDPEMLGKVFENLLEVKDRKSKGAFYTPREIVHYMCQESLINYLDTTLNSYTGSHEELGSNQTDLLGNCARSGQLKIEIEHKDIKVPKRDIEEFIKNSHLVVEDNRKEKKSYQLPVSIKKHSKLFDKSLADIKVCDPAIGSGAFPVGMLNEIVRARTALTPYMGKKESNKERTQYHLKRDCIRNSLYGVDIDDSAIDVAKLRLWLSLVVDEERIKDIEPLPNLDYKIVCGNSLLGIEIDAFNVPLFEELELKKKDYFSTTDRKEKIKLHKEIDGLIHQISNGREDFDFEVYFSEVWHEKGGFDVVIGNPPYVNIYKIEDRFKKLYSKIFESAYKKYDLFVLFFEKSLNIIQKNGTLNLITSNKYLSQPYGEKIRGIFLENTILHIINFRLNVFEATVDTAITFVKKEKSTKDAMILFKDISEPSFLANIDSFPFEAISKSIINNLPGKQFRIELTQKKVDLIRKIDISSTPIKKICYINYGCRLVSKNGKKKKADYLFETKKTELLKPFIEGQDIRRFVIKGHRWVDYKPKEHYLSLFTELFDANKIVSKEIIGKDGLQFALDDAGYYNDHTVVNIVPWANIEKTDYPNVRAQLTRDIIAHSKEYDLHLLLGILNSRVTYWYFMNLYNIDLHAYPSNIQNLRIPVLKNEDHSYKKIVTLVKKIILKQPEKKDAEIDARVAHLYSLTESEYQLILEGTEETFKEMALKFFRDIEKGVLK